MTGIQTIMEKLNDKYAELKKANKKMVEDIKAFKNATALQIKGFSEGLKKLADSFNTMSIGVHERFNILEGKPCMKITEIFTNKETEEIKNLIKL